ncbi:MAG: hypothetical protein KDG51_08540, partial [Calditrichaeota bacterium]|nr:hypothetical protein [Calditrichota bacterium]
MLSHSMKRVCLYIALWGFITTAAMAQARDMDSRLQPYIDFLDREGRDPLALVLDQIKSYDLLNFWNCGTF